MGQKMGYQNRAFLKLDSNKPEISEVVRALKYICRIFIIIELIGTFLLMPFLSAHFSDPFELFYQSLFLCASAITASGFFIYDVVSLVQDPAVLVIVSFLMMISGIGFPVLIELIE